MNLDLNKKIIKFSKELRIPGIRKFSDDIISYANKNNISYKKFLFKILEKEYELRIKNRKNRRIRLANFPYKKYLEDLKITDLPNDAQNKFKEIKSLDFIKNGNNLILAGNPGTGKTHLAIGLGIKACLSDFKVLFTTIPNLVVQLKETKSERTLRSFQNKFKKYDLIIADELGYISFDKEGAELLFTNLSLRANNKSTIITTNLSFDRWNELFKDTILTTALLDRLTHKAFIINMNGDSFRLKETQEWLNN